MTDYKDSSHFSVTSSKRFVTVEKQDPLFKKYLWGKWQGLPGLNKSDCILPIETLNLNSSEEVVTFQILQKDEIRRPSVFQFLTSLIKLKSYILILLPLFYVLSKNYATNRFHDPFSLALSALAMLFFYAGINIRNDVIDHVSGYDRVNFAFTNKPISLGWLTAAKAAYLSWVLFGISIVMAFPALVLEVELLRLLVVVVGLFLAGQFFSQNSYKQQTWGELILFLLIGPGLAAGFQVSLGAGIDTQILAFGFLWGFAVLFLIHIHHFSHLLTSSQARIQNTITKMGFDRAQFFLIGWWTLFCIFWFVFHLFYSSLFWTIFDSIILVFGSVPLVAQIFRIRSPIGSDLYQVRKIAYRTFLLMTLLLFVENGWSVFRS